MQDKVDIAKHTKEKETPQALTVPSDIKSLVEALVFAAVEPLSVRQMKAIYEYSAPAGSGEERRIESDQVRRIIDELNKDYKRDNRPYRIIRIAGGYQFATQKEYADWLGKLRREQSRRKLSQSGVETLAIIAYKQPVTKAEVESIRGVNCDYVMKTLLEKELVRVTGRAETVGRPLLYGSTREFLVHFGLNEVTDLPRPREIEEILGETQFETERRMLEAQQAAEKVKEEEDFKSRLPHIPKRSSELDNASVEIFPRESRMTIETRRSDALPFDGTDAASPESADGKHDADVPQETSRATTVSHDAGKVPDSEGRDVAHESGISSTPPSAPGRTEDLEPDAAHPHETHAPHSASQATKTRWQSWKQKIQGFIRKLFD